MTLAVWLTLLPASVLISVTPGAGAINTMTNSINEGFRRAIWGILGQQAALVIHILIVAAGVGLLVANSPTAFNLVRYAGAAYLVYLGVRMIASTATATVTGQEAQERRGEPAWSMFRRGLWVNLLNPKAIVFFLAFTPQFIRVGSPLIPQYVTFAATIVVVDILVMWFLFAAAAKGIRNFARTPRGARVMNVAFGVLFILVAGLLALA